MIGRLIDRHLQFSRRLAAGKRAADAFGVPRLSSFILVLVYSPKPLVIAIFHSPLLIKC